MSTVRSAPSRAIVDIRAGPICEGPSITSPQENSDIAPTRSRLAWSVDDRPIASTNASSTTVTSVPVSNGAITALRSSAARSVSSHAACICSSLGTGRSMPFTIDSALGPITSRTSDSTAGEIEFTLVPSSVRRSASLRAISDVSSRYGSSSRPVDNVAAETANAPATAIAVTTAAERQRVRCNERPDSRHEAPSRDETAVAAVIATGDARHIPASTPRPPRMATRTNRLLVLPALSLTAAVATASRKVPREESGAHRHASWRSPDGSDVDRPAPATRRWSTRLRGASSRRSLRPRSRSAAGSTRSAGRIVVSVHDWAASRSISGGATKKTANPMTMPAADPTTPDHVPCSESVRRISRGGRPVGGELPDGCELTSGTGREGRGNDDADGGEGARRSPSPRPMSVVGSDSTIQPAVGVSPVAGLDARARVRGRRAPQGSIARRRSVVSVPLGGRSASRHQVADLGSVEISEQHQRTIVIGRSCGRCPRPSALDRGAGGRARRRLRRRVISAKPDWSRTSSAPVGRRPSETSTIPSVIGDSGSKRVATTVATTRRSS